MNGFGIELIKMMISQKKYSSITDCTKIMYPDKNTNLVIQEHVGDDIRVYKENGTINILCPEKMTVVQEGALAKAIENGTIFDDADTVDNGAKYIELTTLPYRGMCNKGIDMPEKLHKMTSIVIGKMDDDGRCGQCDIDLDTGNKFYKDMINHVDNNTSVADVVTHYVGNKDGFLNNDLRRDMRGVRDEIERVQGIDHEATVSDDDWEYMSMDDPVGESTSPTNFQEGFFDKLKDWFNKQRQKGMDRSQSPKKDSTPPPPPTCPEYDIVKTVLEKIKQDTLIDCISIEISQISQDSVNPTDSVIGGKPPYAEKVPTKKGDELRFLAQINCSELPELKGYPNKGLLQFWVSKDICVDEECEVVYYANPTNNKIDQLNIDMDVYDKEDDEWPIKTGSVGKMTFKKSQESMSTDDYRFDNLFAKAYNEIAKNTEGVEEIEAFCDIKDEIWKYLWNHTDLVSSGDGNKIGGYPHFCQWDPRESEKSEELLLLQIDSDDDFILWGDYGTANFFIKERDLINHKFGNCMFHWDCA